MRNLKKIIALVAVFAMMVSTVAFAQDFTDVTEEHNYYEAIEMLSKLEILTGDDQDGDGKMDFRPEDTITRAEVAAIVSRIQNIDSAAQRATEFVDVPATHWASGYVAQAAGQGIVNGYGDGNFGPEDNVLYEQVIKMLMVTLGYEPFAADNGGYPSGYLTAASRYGVTEGLIGAHVGEEATRGQVAQMVYKAVDTALMDRYVYGDEKEYVIYDGVNRSYMSLLTRDLGVKKGSGIVSETEITTLEGTKAINTEEAAEAWFKFDGVYYDSDDNTYSYDGDYSDYKLYEVDTIYEADSDVSEYLGKHVQFFLKESGRKGDYNLVSVAATNKNKDVTFPLSTYKTIADNEVEFFVSDNKTETVDLDKDGLYVLLNGVYYADVDDASDFASTIATVFAASGTSALVYPYSTYSGSVTLIDNDKDADYDVVSIERGVVGVVDEVSDGGFVALQEYPVNYFNQMINLEFNEEENEQIIKLTKDGEEIEYTELKEWDVLAIYTGDLNKTKYYDVRVLESNAITSSITGSKGSRTSADGYEYLIDGTYYEVAENCYKASGIKIGAAGTFYIDGFDKIVAYDKSGANTASDKYGYILNADAVDGTWDLMDVRTLVLDKNGEVYDMILASTVKVENVPEKYLGVDGDDDGETVDTTGAVVIDSISVKLKDIDVEALAPYMVGKLVTYEANSAGEIKTLTFSQGNEEESTLWLADATTTASYDEDEAELKVGSKTYTLTDDTAVFFVKAETGSFGSYDDRTVASKTTSKVGSYTSIADHDHDLMAAIFDAQDDDIPGAVVLLNTSGGISAKANVAVLAEDAGEAYVDGTSVISVSYYMGGELRYSTTSEDFVDGDGVEALENAKEGSVWKFELSGDGSVIEDADLYATYARDFTEADEAGAVVVGSFATGEEVGPNKENFYFGPIAKVDAGSKKIRIANKQNTNVHVDDECTTEGCEVTAHFGWDGTWNLASLTTIKAEDANIYVVDPNRAKNKVYLGVVGQARADKRLVEKEADEVVKDADGTTIVAAGEQALGMMDYALAVEYDDVVDVVIYKAYDFGMFTVQ